MKDLNYYAQKSVNAKNSRCLECDLTLSVEGEKFHAYEVSVSNCDLLFFCDKGTLNYVIDTYGDKVVIELYNVDKD